MSGEGRGLNVYGISRDLWDHEAFQKEPFTEAQAWAWLIGEASWKDGLCRGNTGQPVELKRAEFSIAVRYLADRWQWTKDRAHRFLKKLERLGMIRDASRDTFQVYFICNYNRFQVVGLPKRDSGATQARQPRDKIETGKQEKEEKKEKGGPAAPRLPGFEFPIWWPTKEWAAFVEMRRKIRKPLTDHAVDLAIKRLTDLRAQGESPADILNNAIFGGWQGLYPKDDRRGARQDHRPSAPPPTDVQTWVWRLETFHHGNQEEDLLPGFWNAKWGPPPTSPDCQAPEEAKREYARRHPPRLAK